MSTDQSLLAELEEQIREVEDLVDENKQLKKELKEAQSVIQTIAKQKLEDINPAENSLEVKAQILEWCINLARKYILSNMKGI